MARSVAWRRAVSDAVSWRQDQSQNAIIYILRETGPTGFLLKEEGETKKYKVWGYNNRGFQTFFLATKISASKYYATQNRKKKRV